jgi:dienelactone hydrolase
MRTIEPSGLRRFVLTLSLVLVAAAFHMAAADQAKEQQAKAEKKEYKIRPVPSGPPEFSLSADYANDPRLEPLHYFRSVTEVTVPKCRFQATTKAAWKKWHADFRRALAETIGLPLIGKMPLKVIPGPVDKLDGYTRMAFTIETAPELYVPAFLLVPDGANGRLPAVLVAHGHGYGMNSVVGLKEDGSPRPFGEGYQHDMGLQAVRAGFVTLVYDQLGFGRRRDFDFNRYFKMPLACEHPSKCGIHFGQSITGLRVFDARRMIDFLQQRREVNPDKIAMVGISGGGLVTQFTAALDDRVKAACISGHINHYATSILSLYHCIDNYVPALGRIADNEDVACLIAPRPLLVEAGTQDPIFPIAATREAIAKIGTCYALLGADNNLDTDIFDKGHEFSGARTWEFFRKHLRVVGNQ